MKTNILRILLLGLFILGLTLLDLSNSSFMENTTAYMLLIITILLTGLFYIISRYDTNDGLTKKLIGLNVLMGFMGICYLAIAVFSEGSSLQRFLKFTPGLAFILSILLVKRDLKRKNKNTK